MNDELKEIMEERDRLLEEVLLRAEKGTATEADWLWLRREFGVFGMTKERKPKWD